MRAHAMHTHIHTPSLSLSLSPHCRLYYHLPSLLYKGPTVKQKEEESLRGKGEVPLFINSAAADASEAVAKPILVQQTSA